MNNDEKRHHMTTVIDGIIDRIKKSEQFNWIREYAEIFISIWGQEEAGRQCRAMIREGDMAPEASELCRIVGDMLHEKNNRERKDLL